MTQKREGEYTRGFLDCLQVLEEFASEINVKLPAEKQFNAVTDALTYMHTAAVEKQNMQVKSYFCIFFDVDRNEKAKQIEEAIAGGEKLCQKIK
jgi:hypothetical protein